MISGFMSAIIMKVNKKLLLQLFQGYFNFRFFYISYSVCYVVISIPASYFNIKTKLNAL